MLKVYTSAKNTTVQKVIISSINPSSVGGYSIHGIHESIPLTAKNDLLLVCGAKALAVLQSQGLLPKGRTVDSLRGEVKVLEGGIRVLITYDPGILVIDTTKQPQINWDIALAVRWLTTGGIGVKVGAYKYVPDFQESICTIEDRYCHSGKRIPITMDLETCGLDPYAIGKYIVSVTLTTSVGVAHTIRYPDLKSQPAFRDSRGLVVIRDKAFIAQIKYLLNDSKIALRGANFKFDMQWIAHHWGITTCKAYSMDTTLVGSLLDENRSNSLNTHAKIYTEIGGYDDEFNRRFDKSRMDLVPPKDLLSYAGGDTDACFRVAIAMKKEIATDKRLMRFYTKLLHPAAIAVSNMERRGMVVNVEAYKTLEADLGIELDSLHKGMLAYLPSSIKREFATDLKVTRTLVLNAFLFSKQGMGLKPIMFTPKSGEPSTAMEHLELLASKHKELVPFVQLMAQYTTAKKTLSTYVTGFRKHVRADGKFHATYMLHRGDYDGGEAGAVSGRSSAKDPAYQTIPKHTAWTKRLRAVFTPPPGYAMLLLDYSQGELKITACISHEPTMLSAYHNNQDLHAVTASIVCGMSFPEFMEQPEKWRDDKRQRGKAGNFGLLYGMGWRGFGVYAEKSYKVSMSDAECMEFRNNWFDKYKGITNWHNECKRIVHRDKCIISPLGRVRRLPLINTNDQSIVARCERQAINFGPQSTLSDLGLYSIGELYKKYPKLWVWGFTHDSLAFYVPDTEMDLWIPRIKDVMENLPYQKDLGWNPELKFTVDAECSYTNWAETVKIK